MLELINISKTYITKSSPKVEALKNINLRLPSKGMALILGASGSGKSTLLNIIGGLDSPTSGSLNFLNKEFSLVNYSELDEYRRNYVGIIFQDFNLINELNVHDNLSLGFTFYGEDKDQYIDDTLKQVGLSGYEKRYPNELSGGEIQRIAIARALLKDSRILLADEPTGNLDKKSGKEIIELLKKISEEKLVITVSHNEDLVKPYSDYIIEIEDGEIVSSNIIEDRDTIKEVYNPPKTKSISNKIAFKMAFHNLFIKKLRFLITLLVMLISYAAISLTISIFQYHPADPHYHLIKTRDYEYFKITGLDYHGYQYIKDLGIPFSLSGAVESKEELLELGIELYPGDIELTEDSYYIADNYLNWLFSKRQKAKIDGKIVELNFEEYEYSDLIGNYLEGEGYYSIFKIAGIYKSPFTKPATVSGNEDESIDYYLNNFYGSQIFKREVPRGSKNDDVDITIEHDGKEHKMDSSFSLSAFSPSSIVIGKDGYFIDYDYDYKDKLQKHEVYLGLKAYNKIFGTNYSPQYFIKVEDGYYYGSLDFKLIALPPRLDERISISIYNRFHNKTETLENVYIKGIVFSLSELNNNNYNESNYVHLNKDKEAISRYSIEYDLWIKTDTIKNLQRFLHKCVDDYSANISTPLDKPLYYFEDDLRLTRVSMAFICIVLTVIVILMTIALISQTIYARKKEIGILKSMGAINKEIKKIFAFEMVILLGPICILSIVSSYFIIEFINYGYVILYNPDYQFIYYKFSNIVYLIIFMVSVNFLATFIPLRKIEKMTIIDAIRK
ncbi:MAG: ATP-binding cassette domain-containing protein [Bacilli bacterium]|nr:ATP-binding cassette domain-containing protein [Bacilli bacterium]